MAGLLSFGISLSTFSTSWLSLWWGLSLQWCAPGTRAPVVCLVLIIGTTTIMTIIITLTRSLWRRSHTCFISYCYNNQYCYCWILKQLTFAIKCTLIVAVRKSVPVYNWSYQYIFVSHLAQTAHESSSKWMIIDKLLLSLLSVLSMAALALELYLLAAANIYTRTCIFAHFGTPVHELFQCFHS